MTDHGCQVCCGRGWTPTWVEDPVEPHGGYEGPERYCDCSQGRKLKDREQASSGKEPIK